VALRGDGTVVAWSYGNSQATGPAGLSWVTAIATAMDTAGGGHTVALKSDGTVAAWGASRAGQTTGTPPTFYPYEDTANPVTLNGVILNGVIAIAAGGDHTVALARFPTASISGPGSVVRRTPFNLTADATGDGPIFYQWQRVGVNLPGATSASLTVSAGEPALGAVTYSVVVSNAYGFSVASYSVTVVNAIRRLPSGYWPQVPFVVEIDYAPRRGVLTHAIVDNLPTDWITELVPALTNQDGALIAYKLGSATVSLQPSDI